MNFPTRSTGNSSTVHQKLFPADLSEHFSGVLLQFPREIHANGILEILSRVYLENLQSIAKELLNNLFEGLFDEPLEKFI